MENVDIQNDSAPEISGEQHLSSPEVKSRVGLLYRTFITEEIERNIFSILITQPENIKLFNTIQPPRLPIFKKTYSANTPTLCKALTSEMEANQHIDTTRSSVVIIGV